jgi:hypothetical protein
MDKLGVTRRRRLKVLDEGSEHPEELGEDEESKLGE